jgi:hypothetical protein
VVLYALGKTKKETASGNIVKITGKTIFRKLCFVYILSFWLKYGRAGARPFMVNLAPLALYWAGRGWPGRIWVHYY